MYRRFLFVAVVVALAANGSMVVAQCGCGPVQPVYAPAVPSYTTYYAPQPYVTNYAPAPHVTYHAPATCATCYAPATPHVNYHAPAVQPYVVNYGVAGWTVYGTPRVYVPGEPVLNVLRAVLP